MNNQRHDSLSLTALMQRWLRAWVVTLKAALNPPDPLYESASGCDLSTVWLRESNVRQTSCRSHPDADETAAYNRPPASPIQ